VWHRCCGSSRPVTGCWSSPPTRRRRARCAACSATPASAPPASPCSATSAPTPSPARIGWAPGLPDDAYEHDGQLTKRDLRASALARLLPLPGQLLWDVGAGAGSIGIEWMRSHPSCRAVAVEQNRARAERIARNAAALGVPGLSVVAGPAPGALEGLPPPDAVFVGGGASAELLDLCRRRLCPAGRLVVHAVTLQTEQLLVAAHEAGGGELTRHAIETAAPLGGFTAWTPARAVVQWAWTKPCQGQTS
jgi:precorrin-6B C5,15-methyltransferase / cobalt-precorrin-6B C5,C15-methyltransferase